MKFSDLTDRQLLNFCYDQFTDDRVCNTLGCQLYCAEESCPLVQLLDRFSNHLTRTEDDLK